MKVISSYESNGDLFFEIAISKEEACDVEVTKDGHIYTMEYYEGKDVYWREYGIDFPCRKLSEAELRQLRIFVRSISKK